MSDSVIDGGIIDHFFCLRAHNLLQRMRTIQVHAALVDDESSRIPLLFYNQLLKNINTLYQLRFPQTFILLRIHIYFIFSF